MITSSPHLKSYMLDYMHNSGISIRTKGSKYLYLAIISYINGTEKMTDIYRKIADAEQTSECSIERGIRNCIKTAWKVCKEDKRNSMFPYRDAQRPPSNGEVISVFANKIALRFL